MQKKETIKAVEKETRPAVRKRLKKIINKAGSDFVVVVFFCFCGAGKVLKFCSDFKILSGGINTEAEERFQSK